MSEDLLPLARQEAQRVQGGPVIVAHRAKSACPLAGTTVTGSPELSTLKGARGVKRLWESFRKSFGELFEKIVPWAKKIGTIDTTKPPTTKSETVAVKVGLMRTKTLFLQTEYLKEAYGEEKAKEIEEVVLKNLAKLVSEASRSETKTAKLSMGSMANPVKISYDSKTHEITVSSTIGEGGEALVRKIVRFGVPQKLSREVSLLAYKRAHKYPETQYGITGRADSKARDEAMLFEEIKMRAKLASVPHLVPMISRFRTARSQGKKGTMKAIVILLNRRIFD